MSLAWPCADDEVRWPAARCCACKRQQGDHLFHTTLIKQKAQGKMNTAESCSAGLIVSQHPGKFDYIPSFQLKSPAFLLRLAAPACCNEQVSVTNSASIWDLARSTAVADALTPHPSPFCVGGRTVDVIVTSNRPTKQNRQQRSQLAFAGTKTLSQQY